MKIIFTCFFICVMMSSLAVAADSYPLHAAIQSGKPSRVRAELRSSRLNQRNYEDMTPLMVAARYDRSTSAGIVLETDVLVDEETSTYGITALMLVAHNSHTNIVHQLLQAGANPVLRDASNCTAKKHSANSSLKCV